jgi:hypothetical protein
MNNKGIKKMAKGNSCTLVSLSQLYTSVKPLFSGVKISGALELTAFTEQDFAKMLVKAAKSGDLRCTMIKGEPVFIEAFANTLDSKVIVKIPMVAKENVLEWLVGKPTVDTTTVTTTNMPGLEKYLQSSDDRWFKLIDGLINHPLAAKVCMMFDVQIDDAISDIAIRKAERRKEAGLGDTDLGSKMEDAIQDAADLGTNLAEEHGGFSKAD